MLWLSSALLESYGDCLVFESESDSEFDSGIRKLKNEKEMAGRISSNGIIASWGIWLDFIDDWDKVKHLNDKPEKLNFQLKFHPLSFSHVWMSLVFCNF